MYIGNFVKFKLIHYVCLTYDVTYNSYSIKKDILKK